MPTSVISTGPTPCWSGALPSGMCCCRRIFSSRCSTRSGATRVTLRSSPAWAGRHHVRFHSEVLRQTQPVELLGGPLVAGLHPLPELALVLTGEGRGVLLGLVLEDRLDLQAQLFL